MDYTKATLDRLLKTDYEEKENHQAEVQPKIHAKKEKNVCSACSFKTPWKRVLKNHMEENHGKGPEGSKVVKPIVKGQRTCPYDNCGKIFRTTSLLKRHILVHTGEKKYVCQICDYKSSWKDNFDRHSKTHTKKNKFQRDELVEKQQQYLGQCQAKDSEDFNFLITTGIESDKQGAETKVRETLPLQYVYPEQLSVQQQYLQQLYSSVMYSNNLSGYYNIFSTKTNYM